MKLKGRDNINTLALTLALSGESVRRDADGIPTSIRVLAPGELALTIDGSAIEGEVTAAHIKSILDYHAMKGELIPVDCEHLLQMLADKKGVDEAELIKTEPLLGEKAAAGFVALKEESDGSLWADVSKWTDRAKELLTSAGDKMYGYFSPVLRGLKNGPLRVTSIALTNVPAINGQDLLAASDLSRDDNNIPIATQTRRTLPMDHLKKLAEMLGLDVAALTAEGADLSSLFEKVVVVIDDHNQAIDTFRGSLQDALALTDDDTLETITGKILSAIEKGKGDSASLTDVQARLDVLEGKEKDRLVADLQGEGKLTEAMLPWAKKQDTAALRDWAETAPVVVPKDRIVKPGDEKDAGDTMALTDMDKKVGAMGGFTPEQIAEANGLKV